MSAQTIQSAKDRFAILNTALSGHNVTNFKIVDGYGWSYTMDGNNYSAQVPEVQQGDADYISTIKSLLAGANGSTGALPQASLTMPWYVYVIGLGIIYVVVKWVYKKFFKRRRR